MATGSKERWPEMTYGGALSFLRRRYDREASGHDVIVSGVPYDCATNQSPGLSLGATRYSGGIGAVGRTPRPFLLVLT